MGKKRILTGLLLICVMVFAGFLTMLVKTLIPYGEADEVYEEIGRASVQMASEIGGEPSDPEQEPDYSRFSGVKRTQSGYRGLDLWRRYEDKLPGGAGEGQRILPHPYAGSERECFRFHFYGL